MKKTTIEHVANNVVHKRPPLSVLFKRNNQIPTTDSEKLIVQPLEDKSSSLTTKHMLCGKLFPKNNSSNTKVRIDGNITHFISRMVIII